MLFGIDFVEANGRMNVINGAAGYSGLQAGFLKTHKMCHRCSPFSHISPQQVVGHKGARLHGENEGHHLIKLPIGERAVIVKWSVF